MFLLDLMFYTHYSNIKIFALLTNFNKSSFVFYFFVVLWFINRIRVHFKLMSIKVVISDLTTDVVNKY